MHTLLHRIKHGADWQKEAKSLFDGQSSFGNGASMRVAPLGAYFGDDLDLVVEQAKLSALTTHWHPKLWLVLWRSLWERLSHGDSATLKCRTNLSQRFTAEYPTVS